MFQSCNTILNIIIDTGSHRDTSYVDILDYYLSVILFVWSDINYMTSRRCVCYSKIVAVEGMF